MAPPPVVTGLSPKEGPPGTKVTIRGEFLGAKANDLVGVYKFANQFLWIGLFTSFYLLSKSICVQV